MNAQFRASTERVGMIVVWWISAAAEILMVQGVEVAMGAGFESFPRGRDCSPLAEKHVHIVLSMEVLNSSQSRASHVDDWPTLRGVDGYLSYTWYC